MRHIATLLYIGLVFFVSSCGQHALDSSEQEVPTIAITQWTDKMEIFMEYETPVKSNAIKFIVHLTKLTDFKAITAGELILTFIHENGERILVKNNELLREGIFTPIATFEISGTYNFKIEYSSDDVAESFDIGEFIVHQSQAEIPAEKEDANGGISFLKEQQWKTDFKTELSRKLNIHSSIIAMGEIMPRQQSYVEIVSPADGVLNIQHNKTMVNPGSFINRGQVALILSPPVNAANSWIEWVLEYERSKGEFERAQNLLKKQSISVSDFEKIKYNYLIQKAKYSAFLAEENSKNELSFDLKKNTLKIKAPIDGSVSDISVFPGQKVMAGQKLMTIIDPELVWLKINLFEKDYYQIGQFPGASLTIPGLDSLIVLDKTNFNVVSKGNFIDKQTGSIPLLVEIKNPSGVLKINQAVQVELYTTAHQEELCIPKPAIYDDDGRKIVFVHIEGETFEKRIVTTGGSYQGWVAILNGIEEGERVVTEGGYQVKLASTSAAIGHPHTH
jgi:membrane fusion protein, heavy metal efflux system